MMFSFIGSVNMRDTMCMQLCMRMASPFPVHSIRKLRHRA
jgi:hypothetical protein